MTTVAVATEPASSGEGVNSSSSALHGTGNAISWVEICARGADIDLDELRKADNASEASAIANGATTKQRPFRKDRKRRQNRGGTPNRGMSRRRVGKNQAQWWEVEQQRWMPYSMSHKKASVDGIRLALRGDGINGALHTLSAPAPDSLLRVPMHSVIVRCASFSFCGRNASTRDTRLDVPNEGDSGDCESSDGRDDATQTPVFWTQIPLLGDRLCDFFVVMKPRDAANLDCVRFGALGPQQGRTWFEWPASSIETIAECVYRVNAPHLRSVPMGTSTGFAINILFRSGTPMPNENSIHVIVRQQFDVCPTGVCDCVFSLEDGVFQVGRTAGYAWMHAPDATALQTWRDARSQRTRNDIRILPADTPILPVFSSDVWAVHGVPLSPPELEEEYKDIVADLLSRKPLSESLLSDLGLVERVEVTTEDIAAAEETIRHAEIDAEVDNEIGGDLDATEG